MKEDKKYIEVVPPTTEEGWHAFVEACDDDLEARMDAVAKAVADLVHETHPDMEVKTARAEGLRDCRKLMTLAKAGKYNGYLLEGMACPGGCVAGAGTLLPVDLASKVVGRYQSEADRESPLESDYKDIGHKLD